MRQKLVEITIKTEKKKAKKKNKIPQLLYIQKHKAIKGITRQHNIFIKYYDNDNISKK